MPLPQQQGMYANYQKDTYLLTVVIRSCKIRETLKGRMTFNNQTVILNVVKDLFANSSVGDACRLTDFRGILHPVYNDGSFGHCFNYISLHVIPVFFRIILMVTQNDEGLFITCHGAFRGDSPGMIITLVIYFGGIDILQATENRADLGG